MESCIYVFLDEGGNLDFSATGTRYFTLTSVVKTRPFKISPALEAIKYDHIEAGKNIQRFHACEDSWPVRQDVFNAIAANLDDLIIDSLIVEKRKTGPSLQDVMRFYPEMLGYLLRYVVERVNLANVSEVIVITDKIPVNKKRKAVEKAVRTTLAAMLPQGFPYRVLHHESQSSSALQIADYCNWAIYRKWDRDDWMAYNRIAPAIRSEFDIFQRGMRVWY